MYKLIHRFAHSFAHTDIECMAVRWSGEWGMKRVMHNHTSHVYIYIYRNDMDGGII